MIRVVDGKPFVRACRSMPSDGNEKNKWVTPIATLHEALTTLRPLEGAAMMARPTLAASRSWSPRCARRRHGWRARSSLSPTSFR